MQMNCIQLLFMLNVHDGADPATAPQTGLWRQFHQDDYSFLERAFFYATTVIQERGLSDSNMVKHIHTQLGVRRDATVHYATAHCAYLHFVGPGTHVHRVYLRRYWTSQKVCDQKRSVADHPALHTAHAYNMSTPARNYGQVGSATKFLLDFKAESKPRRAY